MYIHYTNLIYFQLYQRRNKNLKRRIARMKRSIKNNLSPVANEHIENVDATYIINLIKKKMFLTKIKPIRRKSNALL